MFFKDLKEQIMKIINTPQKIMTPLNNKEKKTHENQYICYMCKKEFITDKKKL